MIDRDEVLRLAGLSRISLTADDPDRLAADLTATLEQVARLDEIDVSGVEPTVTPLPLQPVLREDRPRAGLTQQQALDQTADVQDGFVRVPSPEVDV